MTQKKWKFLAEITRIWQHQSPGSKTNGSWFIAVDITDEPLYVGMKKPNLRVGQELTLTLHLDKIGTVQPNKGAAFTQARRRVADLPKEFLGQE